MMGAYLFVLLQGGVELLGQVVGYIRHSGLLLVCPAQATLVLIGLLAVFLLAIFAVTWCALGMKRWGENERGVRIFSPVPSRHSNVLLP